MLKNPIYTNHQIFLHKKKKKKDSTQFNFTPGLKVAKIDPPPHPGEDGHSGSQCEEFTSLHL